MCASAAKKAATEADFQMNFAKGKLEELETAAATKQEEKKEAEREEDRAANAGDDDAEGLVLWCATHLIGGACRDCNF